MQVLPTTQRKEAVIRAVDQVLRKSLGPDVDMSVKFVSPKTCVFSTQGSNSMNCHAPGRTLP